MKQERLLKIILAPHVSEKATNASEKGNQLFVFKVIADATKHEIKDSVESLFNTKVKSVHIVNVISKAKTFRGTEGKRKGWKKAYVTLQADQKLDIIGAQ